MQFEIVLIPPCPLCGIMFRWKRKPLSVVKFRIAMGDYEPMLVG
jgi:hypothetical protein